MVFTLTFLKTFLLLTWLIGPIIGLLLILIIILGQVVGRLEGWSRADALYYSFITATTVGYGDFRPGRRPSKLIAIAVAMLGLLCTGIIVAIGLESLQHAFAATHDVQKVERWFDEGSGG